MAKLVYATPTSLDGYIADENYDWSAPDEEGVAFISDLMRPIGMYLYGRKMYGTMAIWQTPDVIPGRTPATLDFARIWQAADKIVYSKSLETVSTPKTRLEREFDPQAVRDLKAQLPHDVSVGGPTLAAQAIRTGLVDEYHLFVVPTLIGGGKRILPRNVCVKLDLLDERRFLLMDGSIFAITRGLMEAEAHTRALIAAPNESAKLRRATRLWTIQEYSEWRSQASTRITSPRRRRRVERRRRCMPSSTG